MTKPPAARSRAARVGTPDQATECDPRGQCLRLDSTPPAKWWYDPGARKSETKWKG